MPNNFPLINELNQFIEQAKDSGLITKWLKGNRFEPFLEKPPEFQFIEINWVAIITLFSICLSILSLASVVLIIEIIVDKKVRAKNSARYWRYIEMSIDPYRHFLNNDLAYH